MGREILGGPGELPLVKFTPLFNAVGLWDGRLIISDVVIGFIPMKRSQPWFSHQAYHNNRERPADLLITRL